MKTLPAELEALMPEPAQILHTHSEVGDIALFTADQMREAMLAATERAAKTCDQRAADAPSIEEHYSAMECATAIRGSI